jgi:hypothetical protein
METFEKRPLLPNLPPASPELLAMAGRLRQTQILILEILIVYSCG